MIANKLIPIDMSDNPQKNSWIDAAISGVASLLGGILGKNSQSSANKTNLLINRENQKWNEKMMDKQNAWNLAQWNRENEYNSAAQQVARYRAAGLNPYLMMQNGSAGSASSVTSASPGNAGMSNTVSPFDYSAAAAGVGNAVSQHFSNQLMAANVRQSIAAAVAQEKENTMLDTRIQLQLEELKQKITNERTRNEVDKFSLFHAKTMLPGELAQQDLQNSSLAESIVNQRANTLYTEMQTALASANLAWLPKTKEAELSLLAAQTFAAVQAGQLSQKQGELAIQNALESEARTQGQKLTNFQSRYIVSKLSWEADKAKWDAKHAKANSGPDSPWQLVYGANGNDITRNSGAMFGYELLRGMK